MKHSISIRLATEQEKPMLEALQRRASLANQDDREALLANPDTNEIPIENFKTGQAFVAERNGAVLGFSVVLPRDDGNAELDGLFVEPDAWKSGAGRTLVEVSCTHAKENGASYLHLSGNPHAEGFYTACGFEHLGEHQTQFGTGLLMRKKV
jgi:N-acetylglutamate synthase-like GNAT family acetyltransferase